MAFAFAVENHPRLNTSRCSPMRQKAFRIIALVLGSSGLPESSLISPSMKISRRASIFWVVLIPPENLAGRGFLRTSRTGTLG
jgi:hypothetical protein